MAMNEHDMQSWLWDAIGEHDPLKMGDDEAPISDTIKSYQEAGVMTNNKGLVVTMSDGTQFQLTIVQVK